MVTDTYMSYLGVRAGKTITNEHTVYIKTDNAFIESINGRLRQECLNTHWFLSPDDAELKIEAWRRECNESRPHSSLGWITPVEYAQKYWDLSKIPMLFRPKFLFKNDSVFGAGPVYGHNN